ncbi:hypothetical protein TcG_01640 [Trypanosoma cruzi]|nr:hypothetical protein TcBrA4_0088380 [Trypanosoma cruzi]PBJ71791.1 hypothetical protein BCY84_16482 [Trypanosoma cruzi cruzi]RNF23377.1 hypothetical protein TcG_01640 [Trypanosoma cruzi]
MALVQSHYGSDAIHTRLNDDPPSSEEIERRRGAGCLPYSNRLVHRLVVLPVTPPSIYEGETTQSPVETQGTHNVRRANERDRQRRARYASLLRSHYVPLVPFSTFTEPQERSFKVPTISKYPAARRQPQCAQPEEDYMMCGGFYPGPDQYDHRGGPRLGVMQQHTVQLERVHSRHVAPPPSRLINAPGNEDMLFPI